MVEPQFLLLAAMAEERSPFLGPGPAAHLPGPAPHSTLTEVNLGGVDGHILLTGIGPVAAAAALSGYLATHRAPEQVISVGSAGGLHPSLAVGSVVVGESYRYADVDAREFGYEMGQVPGMPEEYRSSLPVQGLIDGHPHTHAGVLLTSSSFVSAPEAATIREHFPDALAVDMESAALAQTCHLYGITAFASIRGISDLCTPRAGEDFHDGLGLAARRSFEVTLATITRL